MANLELDNLFRDLLASNRGPGYSLSVIEATPDLSEIHVDLRFIAGRTYCCAEPGCHLPTDKAQERLRNLAAERAIRLPEAITVHWHCHVEDGASMEYHRHFSLPAETKAYDYDVSYGANPSE